MHPILFRIPLPHRPLMLWWALAAAVVVALGYAFAARRAKEKGTALGSLLAAVAALVAAVVYRHTSFEQEAVPIYSYGVMLGASLVVGWYLTLSLAERDGLPKEAMANCYVVTAIAAVVGSRLLYVVTNLDEFHSFADLFAFRRGGLVVYGGFLGGYLASWVFLKANGLRLMPWADVAVPSLASGLFITRIGCYLFGCDFGKRLDDDAPAFLQKLGTFPHWASGTLDAGEGAPAYARHLELYHDSPLREQLVKMGHSFPVHPTQIYESLCGLALLGLVLLVRKNQKFRGQVFFTFAFAYGYVRFMLEILRDDPERKVYGPALPEHVLLPGALLLMSLGLCFGLALGIKSGVVRTVVRVLGFVPPVVAYAVLKPPSFGSSVTVVLSTSQWIGFATALLVAYFYAQLWDAARKSPRAAMSLASLGPGVEPDPSAAPEGSDKDEEADQGDAGEDRAQPSGSE
jgi:phosphatidylglycerol:prolipoprotein diacylglycerol transferase